MQSEPQTELMAWIHSVPLKTEQIDDLLSIISKLLNNSEFGEDEEQDDDFERETTKESPFLPISKLYTQMAASMVQMHEENIMLRRELLEMRDDIDEQMREEADMLDVLKLMMEEIKHDDTQQIDQFNKINKILPRLIDILNITVDGMEEPDDRKIKKMNQLESPKNRLDQKGKMDTVEVLKHITVKSKDRSKETKKMVEKPTSLQESSVEETENQVKHTENSTQNPRQKKMDSIDPIEEPIDHTDKMNISKNQIKEPKKRNDDPKDNLKQNEGVNSKDLKEKASNMHEDKKNKHKNQVEKSNEMTCALKSSKKAETNFMERKRKSIEVRESNASASVDNRNEKLSIMLQNSSESSQLVNFNPIVVLNRISISPSLLESLKTHKKDYEATPAKLTKIAISNKSSELVEDGQTTPMEISTKPEQAPANTLPSIAGPTIANITSVPKPKLVHDKAVNTHEPSPIRDLTVANPIQASTSPKLTPLLPMDVVGMINSRFKMSKYKNLSQKDLLWLTTVFPLKSNHAFVKLENFCGRGKNVVGVLLTALKPKEDWDEKVYADAIREVFSDAILAEFTVDSKPGHFAELNIFNALIDYWVPSNKSDFEKLFASVVTKVKRDSLEVNNIPAVVPVTPPKKDTNVTAKEIAEVNSRINALKKSSNVDILQKILSSINFLSEKADLLEMSSSNIVGLHTEVQNLRTNVTLNWKVVSDGKKTIDKQLGEVNRYMQMITAECLEPDHLDSLNCSGDVNKLYPLKTLKDYEAERKRYRSDASHASNVTRLLAHLRGQHRLDFKEIFDQPVLDKFQADWHLYNIVKAVWFDGKEDEMLAALETYKKSFGKRTLPTRAARSGN